MILDNADDKDVFTSRPSAHGQASSEKEVRDFLPQSSNGSILVTSRSRDAAFQVTCNYKHIFAVEPMTESEAMALLRIHLEETHPESEMKQLATTLGSVPLAISQAAANISRRSLPISDYLEELRKGYDRSAHLLEESTPQLRRDAGRSNSIVATWKVTFEYVRKTTPSAARLLSLMCCFDCQDVPQALLEDQYGQEINAASVKSRRVWWKRITRKEKKKGKLLPEKSFSHDFEEDLLTLRDFSMIKLNRDRNKFSMHPMVQFTTLRWLFLYQELDAWSQHYISIMNTHFPMPEIGRRKICEPLIAHAVAALPFRPIDKAIRPLQTWAELAFKVACYYDFPTGAVVSPEKLFCIAAAAFEVALGANSSQSIQCNIRRSSVLRFSGHLTDAEKLSRRVLRLRLDSLGPNHPDTLESMDDVADVLKAQKKRGEADEIYVQAINIRLRVLGPAHDDTQRALIFHARSFCNNDDYCGAYKVYRQAYEGRCQGRVGAFDAEWAHHLNNLGLELQVKGRLKEAEQLFREAIAEYGKIEPGWWLIENLVRLGRALAAQDDYVGAEPFYARAMVWYDTERVGEYPEKLPAMEEYAYCLWKLDRLEEAEDIASRCWEARVEECGMQDRDTYSIMWILANILEKRGRDDEALPLFRMAFEGIRDILGEQHEDTTSFQRDYLNLLEKSNSNALEYSDTSTAERVMKSDEIVALAAIHTVDSDKQLSDSDGLVTVAEADEAVLLSEVILERNKASTAANSRLGSYGPERFICDDEKKEASISLNFNVMVERAGIPQLQQI
jgi:tetratricopeptide (TPR) repeat protein